MNTGNRRSILSGERNTDGDGSPSKLHGSNEYEKFEDDVNPTPADVEQAFLATTPEDRTHAVAWLAEAQIDSAPIIKHLGISPACIQFAFVWDSKIDRYTFRIYNDEHIGPKDSQHLAVPIFEAGKFIDLLLIHCDDLSARTACNAADWLGREQLNGSTIRLHSNPLNWLEAGCIGVCYIAPISRAAMTELRKVKAVVCNDVDTAFEAWDWAFGSDYAELPRFTVDASHEEIADYIHQHAHWQAITALRQTDFWPTANRPVHS